MTVTLELGVVNTGSVPVVSGPPDRSLCSTCKVHTVCVTALLQKTLGSGTASGFGMFWALRRRNKTAPVRRLKAERHGAPFSDAFKSGARILLDQICDPDIPGALEATGSDDCRVRESVGWTRRVGFGRLEF